MDFLPGKLGGMGRAWRVRGRQPVPSQDAASPGSAWVDLERQKQNRVLPCGPWFLFLSPRLLPSPLACSEIKLSTFPWELLNILLW